MSTYDINKPPIFDPHSDWSSVHQRWTKWLRQFYLFIEAANITLEPRKKALLLNLAGEAVIDIFDSLPETGNTYVEALTALDNYFKPKKNVQFEIYNFRQALQRQEETIKEYYSRLRILRTNCEFTDVNAEIKTQILIGTTSESLKKEILKDNNITVAKILEKGETDELVDRRVTFMGKDATGELESTVNKVN